MMATLPETAARLERELTFHMLLGPAVIATQGYGAHDVLAVYERAQELCQQLGEPPQTAVVLYNLVRLHFNRAEHARCQELGQRLIAIADAQEGAELQVASYHVVGDSLFTSGNLIMALNHFQRAHAHYGRAQRDAMIRSFATDQGLTNGIFTALALWHVGYPEQAQRQSLETIAHAEALGNPLTLACVYAIGAMMQQYCQSEAVVHQWADAAVTLAVEYRFSQWLGWGTLLQGWVQAARGQGESCLSRMRHGLSTWQSAGATVWVPYGLSLIAEPLATQVSQRLVKR